MATRKTDNQYRERARGQFAADGVIEIDDNAKVSRPGKDGDRGAYVQAWVWVADEDIDAESEA